MKLPNDNTKTFEIENTEEKEPTVAENIRNEMYRIQKELSDSLDVMQAKVRGMGRMLTSVKGAGTAETSRGYTVRYIKFEDGSVIGNFSCIGLKEVAFSDMNDFNEFCDDCDRDDALEDDY